MWACGCVQGGRCAGPASGNVMQVIFGVEALFFPRLAGVRWAVPAVHFDSEDDGGLYK